MRGKAIKPLVLPWNWPGIPNFSYSTFACTGSGNVVLDFPLSSSQGTVDPDDFYTLFDGGGIIFVVKDKTTNVVYEKSYNETEDLTYYCDRNYAVLFLAKYSGPIGNNQNSYKSYITTNKNFVESGANGCRLYQNVYIVPRIMSYFVTNPNRLLVSFNILDCANGPTNSSSNTGGSNISVYIAFHKTFEADYRFYYY